jgi:putative DNA primase/helicase
MRHEFDKAALRNRWHSILASLGVPENFLRKKNGPCPFCGGKDRYRFSDFNGDGLWFCNQCGKGDGPTLAMRYLNIDFPEFLERIAPLVGSATVKAHHISKDELRKMYRRLWLDSMPVAASDPVDRYLTSRGLSGPWPPVLRTLNRSGGVTMLALVMDAHGGQVNIHRTFLSADGKKVAGEASRKMMPGTLPKGIAIRLMNYVPRHHIRLGFDGVPDGVSVLGIAEGIETALSAARLFGVPVWSAIAAQFLTTWVPPEDVDEIMVFGDNDGNFTGQDAAYALATRLFLTNKSVKAVSVHIPDQPGDDWNDVLVKSGRIPP